MKLHIRHSNKTPRLAFPDLNQRNFLQRETNTRFVCICNYESEKIQEPAEKMKKYSDSADIIIAMAVAQTVFE